MLASGMMLSTFGILLLSTAALAQFDYPELPVNYCHTSEPTTPLPNGYPWGDRTANVTNPSEPPRTGVIRSYDWTIARGVKAPDGYEKQGLFINDQYPGPLIEANWGDTIQVTIRNNIKGPEDGTAMHWHGILQKDYPWMDGVPGAQQCPIPSGKSFTYTFFADLFGTGWYHSHYEAQYTDGLFGPMVIHGPKTVSYDIDKGPIFLNDYFHETSKALEIQSVGKDIREVIAHSNNNLINGRNYLNCSKKALDDLAPCSSDAEVSKFKFEAGKTHRLRLINSGGDGIQKFSIDGHSMTIIAVDYVPIKPQDTQVVTLGVGQRTDVLVKGLDSRESYTMRSVLGFCSGDYQPLARAIVYYSDDALGGPPNSTAWPALQSSLTSCSNDDISLTVPWYPITPSPPTVTQEMTIGVHQNASGNWLWTINDSSFRADYNSPILLLSNHGNNTYLSNPEWNVYNFASNTSIRILLRNPGFVAHPMHLHGHNLYILDSGSGEWDGHTIVNAQNPLRRDTVVVPPMSYAVLQFEADNPGAWPFHCHIAAHVSGGLYATILERPDLIAKQNIPYIMDQTCNDFEAWQNSGEIVDQEDSGV